VLTQSVTMPRTPSQALPDSLSPEERKRELTRLRTQNYRASGPNMDNVRRALVAATAQCPEDVRRQVLAAMLVALDEDKREAYRVMACKLLNLPELTAG
jgi:hypothetical protein